MVARDYFKLTIKLFLAKTLILSNFNNVNKLILYPFYRLNTCGVRSVYI
jgi:hypothetical protein